MVIGVGLPMRNPNGIVTRTCPACGNVFTYHVDGHRYLKCFDCRVSQAPNGARPGARLTTREIQVIKLVTQGHGNKEVAGRLMIGAGTIKVYLNHIFTKVGVSNRTELALWGATQQLWPQLLQLIAATWPCQTATCDTMNLSETSMEA